MRIFLICSIVIAYTAGLTTQYYLGKKIKIWDQTSCINNMVMQYRHNYWYDTKIYCTKTLD
jgi:hypothetical protein